MSPIPTVYELKPAFQRSLRPLVGWLAAHDVSANQVTLAALALSLVAGLSAGSLVVSGALYGLLLLPPVLFARMALNAIDGMLAREHGMKSALGGMLNELCDVLADAALLLPFALIPGAPPATVPLVIAATALAASTEVTGLAARVEGASRRYDGPMGKSDRALVVGVLALVVGADLVPTLAVTVVFALMNILLAVTVVHRVRCALAEVSP